MPRAAEETTGALRVAGLYRALLERERARQERADRLRDGGVPMKRNRRLLDALEAGEPAVVPATRLGGHEIPRVPLSREQRQWPNRFVVSADDTVRNHSARG